MTTPTNAQKSERERLVLPMTASMVPHPMYASGWNACLDACKEVLDAQHAEIAALRAENEALRTVTHTCAECFEGQIQNFDGTFRTCEHCGGTTKRQSFIRSKEARRG